MSKVHSLLIRKNIFCCIYKRHHHCELNFVSVNAWSHCKWFYFLQIVPFASHSGGHAACACFSGIPYVPQFFSCLNFPLNLDGNPFHVILILYLQFLYKISVLKLSAIQSLGMMKISFQFFFMNWQSTVHSLHLLTLENSEISITFRL